MPQNSVSNFILLLLSTEILKLRNFFLIEKFIIATKSPSSTVFVFDYSKHGSNPTDNICRPQHRCLGHDSEGYGLAWNPLRSGHLLSGSDDNKVCLWDITNAATEVQPLSVHTGHTNVVEDVDWSKQHEHIFGSVGDDAQLLIWDSRGPPDQPMKRVEKAHSSDINCIAFNPFSDFLLATGSSDSTVALWDMRNMSQKMHTFEGHKNGVYQVD